MEISKITPDFDDRKRAYDFDKNQSCQYQFLLLLLAKSAAVSTLDTPSPSCQQLSAFLEPLPPQKC